MSSYLSDYRSVYQELAFKEATSKLPATKKLGRSQTRPLYCLTYLLLPRFTQASIFLRFTRWVLLAASTIHSSVS